MRVCARRSLVAVTCLAGLPLMAWAAGDDDFLGDWMLTLAVRPANVVGLLQIEQTDGGLAAWVEGGPVGVQVDGDELELVIDSRDIAGFVLKRRLVGTLDDGVLRGALSIVDDAESGENGATWTATRVTTQAGPAGEPPTADLSGIWMPAPGLDFRKYSMDLTPAAEAWHKDYVFHLDQPNVRCVSPGLVALNGWSGYAQEWIQTGDRLTILFEVGSEVRRVFMDGRDFPEDYPNSPMGYSIGHWEGSELVIETRLLSPNVRDFRGEPISENARVIERYKVSEDGEGLSAVITLHDPENYERPPIRRRAWRRDPEAEIYPYECDPDSFFRQLYEEGRIEEYMDRADRRM